MNLITIRRSVAVVFAGILAICCQALATDDPMLRSAKALSPYVTEIKIIGTWSEGGQQGTIRYAISKGGVEEVDTYLFIQWITDATQDNPEQKIVSTIEIHPIVGNLEEIKLVSTSPYKLRVRYGSIFCDEPQLYSIEILSIGKYKLENLNKRPCDPTEDNSGNAL